GGGAVGGAGGGGGAVGGGGADGAGRASGPRRGRRRTAARAEAVGDRLDARGAAGRADGGATAADRGSRCRPAHAAPGAHRRGGIGADDPQRTPERAPAPHRRRARRGRVANGPDVSCRLAPETTNFR